MHPWKARTPNLIVVQGAASDFRWRHAYLGKRLSDGGEHCHERERRDRESLCGRSNENESGEREPSEPEASEHATVLSLRRLKIVVLRESQRNFSSAAVVSFGFSSSTQCPVFFRTTTV